MKSWRSVNPTINPTRFTDSLTASNTSSDQSLPGTFSCARCLITERIDQEDPAMPFLRRGFFKAARRPNNLYCHVNPLPYFGLTIVLLCIFMTTPHANHRDVDLFKTSHATSQVAARKEDAIRISITRDGSIYFRHSHVGLDVLPNRIRDAVLNGAEEKAYLSVDARARYSDVKLVCRRFNSLVSRRSAFSLTNRIPATTRWPEVSLPLPHCNTLP